MNGKRLKAIREQRGFTQSELGGLVGTSIQQIYRYESGANDPTGEMLSRMARILKVSVDYLLDLSDLPTSFKHEVDLDEQERRVVDALRRGDKLEAIRVIVET